VDTGAKAEHKLKQMRREHDVGKHSNNKLRGGSE
jgi:hypothetical protein